MQLVTFGQGGVADTVTLNLAGETIVCRLGGHGAGAPSLQTPESSSAAAPRRRRPWSSSLPMSLTGSATVEAGDPFGNPQSISLSGNLSGSGPLTVVGGRTLTLSGTNTYAGGTIVNGGDLILTSATAVLDGSNVTVGLRGLFLRRSFPRRWRAASRSPPLMFRRCRSRELWPCSPRPGGGGVVDKEKAEGRGGRSKNEDRSCCLGDLPGVLVFIGHCGVSGISPAHGFAAALPAGGSKVYHVTNLNDRGPGSFRDAVSKGHRIVILTSAVTSYSSAPCP